MNCNRCYFPGLVHPHLYPGKVTHLCQKLCSVVYPVTDENLEPIEPQKTDGDEEEGTSPQTAD